MVAGGFTLGVCDSHTEGAVSTALDITCDSWGPDPVPGPAKVNSVGCSS